MESRYIVSDTDLTSIADSIREVSGYSGSLTFPSGFVSAIERYSSDCEIARSNDYAFLNGSFSSTFADDTITTIKAMAFYGCSTLTSVSFPACTTIGSSAFRNTGIKKVHICPNNKENIPAVRTILKNGGYLLDEFTDDGRLIERYEIVLE